MPEHNQDSEHQRHPDQDCRKGAVEGDGNTSLKGQLGHRDQNPLLKDSDTDFPEPGGNPEHSGEPEEDAA